MTDKSQFFSTDTLTEKLSRFDRARVAVIGDVMLDRYFWGSVDRISPEAPVPVVRVGDTTVRLGGAANVAANIRSLGGEVSLIGVTGADEGAAMIRKELAGKEIEAAGLLSLDEIRTTEKIRVIAHNQQVVRADFETAEGLGEKAESRLLEKIAELASEVDAILISDYGKGVVTGRIVSNLVELGTERGMKVVVDPKEDHFDLYRGVTVLTPNLLEAGNCFGKRVRTDDDLRSLGPRMIEFLRCEAVLITRGERGMSLFERSGEHTYFRTVAREVFDVTGAGDTVAATLATALASGMSMKEATDLANHAAGLVVGELGTAAVTTSALVASYHGA